MWKLKYLSGQYDFSSLKNFFSLPLEESKDKREEAMKIAEEKITELKKEAEETYGNLNYFREFQLVWVEGKEEKEVYNISVLIQT